MTKGPRHNIVGYLLDVPISRDAALPVALAANLAIESHLKTV